MIHFLFLLLCLAGLAHADVPGDTAAPSLAYAVVGTGQVKCYDSFREIACPAPGQFLYGQDAQHPGRQATYRRSADKLTVHDIHTGLTWQRSPDTNGDGLVDSRDKLTFSEARRQPQRLNAIRFGGFNDWRLPTIKELYSLILFSGVDAGPPGMAASMAPFIDTNAFSFAYGDPRAGERPIDSQWATATTYVADATMMFGVNFADGRIKGYGMQMPGRPDKTFFVISVRGNPRYGRNEFHDNGDGSVSDKATGLMWAKADSAQGMDWATALAWVQARNREGYLGYRNWRLPNAKELQTIVDYSRSPGTSKSAALDPVFESTRINNEMGQPDFPYYWTSTTHAGTRGGEAAAYLAFGRAAGWMPSRPGGPGMQRGPQEPGSPGGPGLSAPGDSGLAQANLRYQDVHGAGAQRSDPKAGDPVDYPRGRGPQGDVIRIRNFVRCVRDELATSR